MPPLDMPNIGDNIEKGAEGFAKVTNTIKGNPIVTAIVMIIVCAVITIYQSIHFSNLAANAKDEQRKEDNAYWQPQVTDWRDKYDSVVRVNIKDSLMIELYKQELKMFNKKVDSIKNS